MQKKFRLISLLFLVLIIGFAGYLAKEIRGIKIRGKANEKAYASLRKRIQGDLPLTQAQGLLFPTQLENIPLAETAGIVLDTKLISIRDVVAPYNASLIDHGDHYLLFFRYDEIASNAPRIVQSHIGCVKLNRQFEQTEEEFVKIDTQSDSSEDPRILKVGEELHLVYNDRSSSRNNHRSMHIAKLDPLHLSPISIANLDLHRQPVEKNWVPFAFSEDLQNPKIYFEYYLAPRKLLRLESVESGTISFLENTTSISPQRILYWPRAWGSPRGGTPAIKIGDEYLAFFHSSFRDREGLPWYVMGAYTFEANAPFRVTAISHYPILFQGIYTSPPLNTASPLLRCIFPCGFATEHRDGKDLIHLSCGENDSCIKIITLDQELLLKSLKKI